MLAQMEDGDVTQRLASFRALLTALSGSPHRKTVVLISGGMVSSDRPGGRPDIGAELGTLVGQEAARANATVYKPFSLIHAGWNWESPARRAPAHERQSRP